MTLKLKQDRRRSPRKIQKAACDSPWRLGAEHLLCLEKLKNNGSNIKIKGKKDMKWTYMHGWIKNRARLTGPIGSGPFINMKCEAGK